MNQNKSLLDKSKISHQKHNTTFNEDTMIDNQTGSNMKTNGRQSVFDRLYQESKTKRRNYDR